MAHAFSPRTSSGITSVGTMYFGYLADRIEEIQVIPIKQRFDAGSLEWMRKKLLIGPGGDEVIMRVTG